MKLAVETKLVCIGFENQSVLKLLFCLKSQAVLDGACFALISCFLRSIQLMLRRFISFPISNINLSFNDSSKSSNKENHQFEMFR